VSGTGGAGPFFIAARAFREEKPARRDSLLTDALRSRGATCKATVEQLSHHDFEEAVDAAL